MSRRYGDAVAHSYGLDTAPLLTTGFPWEPQMSAMHLVCDTEHAGLAKPIPSEDVFSVGVNPVEIPRYELYGKRQPLIVGGFPANTLRIVNLTDEIRANIFPPHETVCFYIPHASLDVVTEEDGLPRVENLFCPPGILDTIMADLAKVMLLSLKRPQEASMVFTNQMMLAICSHLIDRYSDKRPSPAQMAGGGLTRAQETMVKEMLSSNLRGSLSIGDLARECDLPRLHLIRAFKKTTGYTPHQWLQWKRVDQARDMLKNTRLPLDDIALQCGFTDQTHMNRVFTALAQTSPKVWREQNRG